MRRLCAGVVPARSCQTSCSRSPRAPWPERPLAGVALHSNNAKRRRFEHTSACARCCGGPRERKARSPSPLAAACQRGCRCTPRRAHPGIPVAGPMRGPIAHDVAVHNRSSFSGSQP